jgi:predicted nuclease of predicted toxin-antitoxin system
VTLDADFHAILAVRHLKRPSVIRFRIENMRGTHLAERLVHVQEKTEEALNAGAMVTVTARAIRVHRLR